MVNIRESYDVFLKLVKSSYECTPKMLDTLEFMSGNGDLEEELNLFPGQKEIYELYKNTLRYNHRLPVYGRIGRLFPSTLVRNDDGNITKVQILDVSDDEKAKEHIALTRNSYTIETGNDENDKEVLREERLPNNKKMKFKVLGFNITLRVSGNYSTILFDKPLQGDKEPMDHISDYVFYDPNLHPILNKELRPGSEFFITNNTIGNDEYTSHTFFIPYTNVSEDTKSLRETFEEIMKSKVPDTNMSISDTVILMYLQVLSNLYMPNCFLFGTYQGDIDKANENLFSLIGNFDYNYGDTYQEHDIFSFLRSEGFNFDNTMRIANNPEASTSQDNPEIKVGDVLEVFSKPTILAKTDKNDHEQFYILRDVSCMVEVVSLDEDKKSV